jgi:hypothetical protein
VPWTLDAEYRLGRPAVYLTSHERARLSVLRSRLGDTRAEREFESPHPQLRTDSDLIAG